MKYERLTDRKIAEMLRNTEGESWDSDNIEAQCYIRLAELEDKIESGELISTVQSEQAEQEIAFFVEHNQIVRKTVIKQFAKDLKEKEQSIKVGNEWVAIITDKDIDELLHKRYSIRLEEEADNE